MTSERQRQELLSRLAVVADGLAVESLSAFVRRAWHVINPGRTLVWGWHLDAICEHLEAITNGQLRKLVINVPPGHSKTTIVTICWSVWEWLRRPELRYLFASYADSLSAKASIDRRTIVKSAWYQGVASIAQRRGAPSWRLDTENIHTIRTTRGGEMLATSVGGMATGRHADRNIVDDPLKAEDVYTVELENHVRWFRETLASRVTSVTESAFVVVMQRLHVSDLSGVLIEDPDWCHLKLPAEYEQAKAKPNALGWVDPRSVEGEPLFPERFPVEYLAKRKGPFGIGPVGYSAQDQQDPIAGSGNIFKRSWWRFWWNGEDKPAEKEDALPDDVDAVVGSWDMTFKGGLGSDFVVGQVWAIKGANLYLLDQTRARLTFSETEAAFLNLRRKWPMVTRWLVEEKANGAAIIDRLRLKVPGIIPINPVESKEARATAVSGFAESGNVYLPPPARFPWVLQLIEEAAAFPHGTYDDQVDAMSQALRDLTLKARTRFTLPGAFVRSPSPKTLDVFTASETATLEAERRRRRVRGLAPGLPSARRDPAD